MPVRNTPTYKISKERKKDIPERADTVDSKIEDAGEKNRPSGAAKNRQGLFYEYKPVFGK